MFSWGKSLIDSFKGGQETNANNTSNIVSVSDLIADKEVNKQQPPQPKQQRTSLLNFDDEDENEDVPSLPKIINISPQNSNLITQQAKQVNTDNANQTDSNIIKKENNDKGNSNAFGGFASLFSFAKGSQQQQQQQKSANTSLVTQSTATVKPTTKPPNSTNTTSNKTVNSTNTTSSGSSFFSFFKTTPQRAGSTIDTASTTTSESHSLFTPSVKEVQDGPIIAESDWKDVKLTAGMYILRRYESMWDTLHVNNVDLARLADMTNRNLESAVIRVQENLESPVNQFTRQMNNLPKMLASVNKIMQDIGSISSRIQNLEEVYDKRVYQLMEKNFIAWKKNRSDQLSVFEEQKLKELKELQLKLKAEKRLEKHYIEKKTAMERAERKHKKLLQKKQRERERLKAQQLFQRDFQLQVSAYLQGDLAPESKDEKNGKEEKEEEAISLEEVTLDANLDSLNDFLGGITDDEEGEEDVEEDIGVTVEVIPIEDEVKELL